ncbi:unnamed protein product [Rotaria sp. Silwood2]|nr:unnamed protein product [Rotaria sp. Silwood2]CAF3194499.1 unnamed protein product [Rotaria sp. Silwood2]CAF4237419.1 unnamed protein product [Rotaria sp. Silwood2]CAF4301139.1 unnamed protein product [Rotaria sp. Silwood2]
MLAQILHDLYIPQELLDELPEDHKQILFCKMREEQVRRYHEREAGDKMRTAINKTKKKKQVTFRLDADGNEWCWVMGESSENCDEQSHNRTNNENMEVDYPNDDKQLKTNINNTHSFPVTNGVFYTVHRDERKQIEEISNNIQEARRIFERLESETRRLALTKENEMFQKQQQQQQQRSQNNLIPISQSDFVDEIFYHEIEKRAKKADQERREVARRARDLFHRQSSQINVCFDTDNEKKIILQSIPLNSSNRTTSIEKNVEIEFEEKEIPAFPIFTLDNSQKLENDQESKSTVVTAGTQQSKPISSITRADIHQWFRTNEIPYGKFRSSNGQIYPWFHGIISRAYTEQLLSSKPIGSYLIRVSEKMFGYVLSYLASDHCRHLLIEVIQQEHAYRFLGGAKNELFQNLNQLIEKYTNTPIRSNSTDVLRYPCGQIDPERTDYADLFVENIENDKLYEYLYISLDTTTSSPQSTTHL